jgi:hypothetical protein
MFAVSTVLSRPYMLSYMIEMGHGYICSICIMIASTIDRLIVHKVEAFPSEAFAQGREPRLMLAEENNRYHENPVLCIEVK